MRFNSSIGLTAVLTITYIIDHDIPDLFQFLNRTNRCSDLNHGIELIELQKFQFLNRTNRCSDAGDFGKSPTAK